VRAVTVRAIELIPKSQPEQLTIFCDHKRHLARDSLEDAIEEIRGRFGKQAITYGILLGDLKMPDDGRDKVKMPELCISKKNLPLFLPWVLTKRRICV
jgi:DNA polymerase-4